MSSKDPGPLHRHPRLLYSPRTTDPRKERRGRERSTPPQTTTKDRTDTTTSRGVRPERVVPLKEVTNIFKYEGTKSDPFNEGFPVLSTPTQKSLSLVDVPESKNYLIKCLESSRTAILYVSTTVPPVLHRVSLDSKRTLKSHSDSREVRPSPPTTSLLSGHILEAELLSWVHSDPSQPSLEIN